ncbi:MULTISPECIES: CHAT domain-containing protein [Nostoc]|uniref:CHAT domain-containing protein n=1 Tax=Nostoc paludosum FACHB-159 TaxID=2692908 RepID=A0ABR8KG47_9NOSO|nr:MULTISPECIES: CHAT domain-containing protein [Nostoc]MBD2680642.1 CHAT domain-containing protein [Nostoc sp. FACHB-857]MBD2737037.1 CHAT domain-containing protein [Nostoc paludosum FACHB-159]
MAKKQPRFWRQALAFVLCVLLGLSLTLIFELKSLGLTRGYGDAGTRRVFFNKQLDGLDKIAEKSTEYLSNSTLIQQGRELYQGQRYAEAINIWDLALKAENNPSSQAMVLNYLSLAYQQLGDWQQASETINSSLNLIQNFQQTTPQTKLIFAQALNTQGSLQLAQGKTEEALNTWQQATNIYTATGYTQGRIGSLINQAQAQQALGLYLQARKTLAQVEQTLENQPDQQLKTTGLRSLGNVLKSVGAFADSRRVLQQSLQLSQNVSKSQPELSATLLSLGNTAYAQGDTDAALAYYEQAANIVSANSMTQIQAQINQLQLLIATGQTKKAENLSLELQPKFSNLSPSRSTIYSRINLAKSLVKLGTKEYTTSAKLLAIAIQEAENLSDRQAQSYALGYLGGLYEQTEQWPIAEDFTYKALQIAQAINAPHIAYQWQWQLGRILKAQGEIKQATSAYEVAFTTLKSLRSDLVAINSDIQFSFREAVEPVYREYVQLLLNPEPSQEQLKQARQVIESLQLAELDNFFRSACLQGQIVPIEQIQQSAAAVVYPIILSDRLEVILSLPQQGLRHYATKISQSEVEEVIEQLRENLEKPFTTPEGKLLSAKVYDWLIRPVEAELAKSQVKTLVFVLDGALRNVPIAALYDGNNYLVEKYSIALTPGLELLGPRPLRQSKLKTLVAGLTEARHGFSSLPNVSEELKTIESEVPSEVLLNQTFTSSALRKQIDSVPFSVVHLATHGQFSSNADETFVLAWDKPIKLNELKDLLRSREQTTPEPIELLVLSACETAEGDKRAALGLAGVAIQAGARSTLASLWSLDDESGARLVGQFYKELATKQVTKAEALRQAQLSLLKDPDYRHPIHWAAYVLLGNWL